MGRKNRRKPVLGRKKLFLFGNPFYKKGVSMFLGLIKKEKILKKSVDKCFFWC